MITEYRHLTKAYFFSDYMESSSGLTFALSEEHSIS